MNVNREERKTNTKEIKQIKKELNQNETIANQIKIKHIQ